MTAVLGAIDVKNRTMYFGGDSCGIDPVTLDYEIRSDTKVFERGAFLFGFSSSFRMGQILCYSFEIPKHKKDVDDFEYLCTDFIDSLRTSFDTFGFSPEDPGESFDGEFLLGYHGKIYKIYGDYQVSASNSTFASVGCGESYTVAAYAVLDKFIDDTKQKVLESLKISSRFNAGVRPPYIVISKKF